MSETSEDSLNEIPINTIEEMTPESPHHYDQEESIFSLRITHHEDYSFELEKDLLKKFLEKAKIHDYLFATEQPPDGKLHLQGYIKTDKSNLYIRKIFKETFPVHRGNEYYGLQSKYGPTGKKRNCDEKLLNYCCKGAEEGNFEVEICSKNHIHNLNNYHKEYYNYLKTIDVVKKNHKASVNEFYQKVYRYAYPQNTIDGKVLHSVTHSQYIFGKIVNYFVENQVLLTESRFRNCYSYILVRVNPEEYKNLISKKMMILLEF